jgi:hypothetical protein
MSKPSALMMLGDQPPRISAAAGYVLTVCTHASGV